MQWDKSRVKGWGRPNKMCNTLEKTSKVNIKKGTLNEQTTTHPHLALHNTLNAPNANQNANKK
jgi:hypothetical protein